LEENNGDGAFFPGRCAIIKLKLINNKEIMIGTFGIVHPLVLKKFGINHPTSALEIDLEPLMDVDKLAQQK